MTKIFKNHTVPMQLDEFIRLLDANNLNLSEHNVSSYNEFCGLEFPKPPIPPIPMVGGVWVVAMWVCFGVLLFFCILGWVLIHLRDTVCEKVIMEDQMTKELETKEKVLDNQ